MAAPLIEACVRLRAEAATDDPDVALDKVRALIPLLEDLSGLQGAAAAMVCEQTLQIVKRRQAGQ